MICHNVSLNVMMIMFVVQNGGMAEWYNGGMAVGMAVGMAKWQNGGMAEW